MNSNTRPKFTFSLAKFPYFVALALVTVVSAHVTSSQVRQPKEHIEDGNEEAPSAIYYEKPSLARLSTAVSKQLNKGCLYNKQKYINGEEVSTGQPCLRCICKKGVLLCALRVCPPVAPTVLSSLTSCQIVREPNTCCPKLKCTSPSSPTHNFSSGIHHASTMTPMISLQSDSFQSNGSKTELSEDRVISNPLVSIKHVVSRNTTVLQTVPSSTLLESYPPYTSSKDSPLLISRPSIHSAWTEEKSYLHELLNGFGKHCYINGTFYAEGSAILASTFCEYCYCIRGKRMCIRPRCHLSILGCLPKYASEYACCPTSYACGEDALNSSKDRTKQWPMLYSLTNDKLFDDKNEESEELPITTTELVTSDPPSIYDTTISNVVSRMLFESDSTPTTITNPKEEFTTTASTQPETTTSTSMNEEIISLPNSSRMTDCIHEGVSYKIGDPMPSNASCTQCYCAVDGTRVCQKIQCTLYIDHDCVPVIPEGHCCPIEYKCPTLGTTSPSSLTNEIKPNLLAVTKTNVPNKQENDSTEQIKNQAQPLQDVESSTNQINLASNKLYPNLEVNLNQFNNETKIEQKVTQNNRSSGVLEARNLSDEPVSTEKGLKSQSSVNESVNSNVSLNNSNNEQIKLENVANFFNNIFNVLGLATQNNPESSQHETSSMKSRYYPDAKENQMNTQLPMAQQQQAHKRVEPVKSLRELPPNINYLPMNYMHIKPPSQALFSNGWRAIPNMKSKPSQQRPNEISPNQVSQKEGQTTANNFIPTTNVYPNNSTSTIKSEKESMEATSNNSTPNAVYDHQNQTKLDADIKNVKCMYQDQEFENGAIIPKSKDPCIYCRCFYGQEICQEQKCPTPPSPECTSERIESQCCPIYTCKTTANLSSIITDTLIPSNITERHAISDSSPIRKAPQYQAEMIKNALNQIHKDNAHESTFYKQETHNRNRIEIDKGPENKANIPVIKPPPYVPSTQPRISLPFDPLPRPLDLIYGSNMQNRIHFPGIHKPIKHSKPMLHVPSNINGIYGPPIMHNPILSLNKPFLNRPMYHYPNQAGYGNSIQSHQQQQPHQHQSPPPPMHNNEHKNRNPLLTNSPIRPLPQSPMQIETVTTGQANKPNMNAKPVASGSELSSWPRKETAPQANSQSISGISTTTSTTSTSTTTASSNIISTGSSTIAPFTTTAASVKGPWDIVQVSGCNIYGKMYQTKEEITELSNQCKTCVCTSHGVQCKEQC